MNVLVVDTSSWISYFNGKNNDDIELALKEARVYLPPIVVAELMSGKMKSSDIEKLQSFLNELPLCETNIEHWVRVGKMRRQLMAKGLTVSTPDAHVAQCALDLDGYLVTEDRIFSSIAHQVNLKTL